MADNSISSEMVRAAVKQFWDSFSAKSGDQLEDLYEPHATVWNSTGARLEPARLAVMRRRREYFASNGSMIASAKNIEVRLLGNVAIACYAFEFSADRVHGALSSISKETIALGRATQVFIGITDSTKVLIAHEHLSVAAETKNNQK